MNGSASIRSKPFAILRAAALLACSLPSVVVGQAEGGVYIAGYGFSFEQAAAEGIAKNPKGQRFFLLALPPNTDALTRTAGQPAAAARDRAVARGAVLLVCQRDIDNGSIEAAKLVPGVVAVRGFPPPGSNALPPGERYFPGESRENLPKSTEALRRIRTTCS